MLSTQSSGSPSWRRRLISCGIYCASLLSAHGLFAQAGSADLAFDSPVPVAASALEAFPFFSELRVYPIVPQRAAGDPPIATSLLILDRFISYLERDEFVDGETIRERVMTAEYAALNPTGSHVAETGVLAFKLATTPATNISGNGVIGFIRSSTAPSDLPPAPAEEGYLTGLEGSFSWDFRSASRAARFEGSGAHYAPAETHVDNFMLETQGLLARFRSLELPVAGSDTRRWWFNPIDVRPVGPGLYPASSSTRIYPEESQFYGMAVRSDGWSIQDLEGLVPEDSNPRSYLNAVYIARVVDENDRDGDGIPDFLDLAQTLEAFPSYADFASPSSANWFYTTLSEDWVHSTTETPWDYANKFGWTFVPDVSSRSDFWFYGDSSELGWLYTTEEWFPTVYRYNDETYLHWISTEQLDSQRRRSVLYNYHSGRFEIIDF